MSKFKAGDKVVSKKNITDILVKGKEYTVYKIGLAYGSVYLEEHRNLPCGPAFSTLSFYTLAESQQQQRNALEAAIELCQSYRIGFTSGGPQGFSSVLFLKGERHATQKEALDELFPTETPQQKEIARIEAEMRKLSNDLAKLKN
jgi:hypothetical protein